MNNCGCGRRKSLSFRFHEIATQARNDKVFGLRPKRKPIRSVLINGMCIFGVSVRKANAEISAELDDCTSEQVRVVLCTCERVA